MFVVATARLAVRAPFDRRNGGLCVGIVAGLSRSFAAEERYRRRVWGSVSGCIGQGD
jgi:hypothetical protein